MANILILSELEFDNEILNNLYLLTLNNDRYKNSYIYFSFNKEGINKYYNNQKVLIKNHEDVLKEIKKYKTEGNQNPSNILVFTKGENSDVDKFSRICNEVNIIWNSKSKIHIFDYISSEMVFNFFDQHYIDREKIIDLKSESFLKIREEKINSFPNLDCTYFYVTDERVVDENLKTSTNIIKAELIEKLTSLIFAFLNNFNFNPESRLQELINTIGISQIYFDYEKVIEGIELFYTKQILESNQKDFSVKSIETDLIQSEMNIYFRAKSGDGNNRKEFVDSTNLENIYDALNNASNPGTFKKFIFEKKEKEIDEKINENYCSFPISNLFNPFSEYSDFNYCEPNHLKITKFFNDEYDKFERTTLQNNFVAIYKELVKNKTENINVKINDKIIQLINDDGFSHAYAFTNKLIQLPDDLNVFRGNVFYQKSNFSLSSAETPSIQYFLQFENTDHEAYIEKIQDEMRDLKNILDEVNYEIHNKNKFNFKNKKNVITDGNLTFDNIIGEEWESDSNVENPKEVDLRKYLTKVEDQSQIGSCTANAITGALEFYLNKDENKNIDLSRLFIYYNARARVYVPVKDEGSGIKNALDTIIDFGVCEEKYWKYLIGEKNSEPSTKAYIEAEKYKITNYRIVKRSIEEFKKCLALGFPIVFQAKINKEFGDNKFIATPKVDDEGFLNHSNHAMLICGYKNEKGKDWFIVRNSWGEDWCEKGYCYFPIDYLMNEGLTANYIIILN